MAHIMNHRICHKEAASWLERYVDINDPPVRGRGHIANPQVSIILPTFSRARTGTLHMAIESVLAQSFGELELIVVDDGSTDGTAEVVQRYAQRDNRVVHIRYERNCGFPAPRMNAGMLAARGKYIGFVFDDGCLYQHAVERLYQECETRPNTVCYGLCNEYRGSTVMTWGFAFSEYLLRHKNLIPNNAVLFPREIAQRCGGYDHNVLLRRVNDWDLWRRYARSANFHRTSDIVAEEHGPNQPDSLENAITMHQDMAVRLMRVDRDEKLTLPRLSERNLYGLEDFGENLTGEDLLRAFSLFAEYARMVRDEEAVQFFDSRRKEIAAGIESGRSIVSLPPRTLRVCHLRSGSETQLSDENEVERVLQELVSAGQIECRRVAQKGAHYFQDAFDWLSFDVYVFDWPVDETSVALMEGLRAFGRPAILNIEVTSAIAPGASELLTAALDNAAIAVVSNGDVGNDLDPLQRSDKLRVLGADHASWLGMLHDCAESHKRKRNPVKFGGGYRGAVGPNRYAGGKRDGPRVGDFVHLQAREFNARKNYRNELRTLNYLLHVNPAHVPAALDRAGLLRKARKYDVALKRLEPTLALHPENHELAACAMELALELGDRRRAAEIFTAYLEANLEPTQEAETQSELVFLPGTTAQSEPGAQTGRSAEEFVNEASRLMDGGDLRGARDVALEALCAHPTRPELYVLYGDCHMRAGDFLSAARTYFAALCFDPVNEAAQRGLERAGESLGQKRALAQTEPEFSVLINTWNRAGWLRKCLAGYCVQTFSPDRFEVVVVDDGSEDDTRAVVESFGPYLNIRYVRQDHAGMAIARTRLFEEAQGPLLGFFDDDDIVAPTCVEEHWKAHQEHPELEVAVLGYSEWSPELKLSPLMHYATDVGRNYVDYPSLTHGQFYDFRCFWGGRSSCKRELLEGSELFDPQFTFGYEDVELMYRLSRRRPVRVFYNRNAVHRFMQPMDLDAFLRRSERQGRTAYFFFHKHRDPALKQYLPIENAVSTWSDVEPMHNKLLDLARKLERVVQERFPESLGSEECKELFLVYRRLYEGAWAKGVIAGREEKLDHAIEMARTNQNGPRILILDEILPVPDRTAGALRMHRIVDLLVSLGCQVTYGAYLPHGYDDHSERLNRRGVRTVYLGGTCSRGVHGGTEGLARARQAVEEIHALGERYDIIWICFHWLARIYLPLIRLKFPDAKVLVDSVDLHYIREARAARIANDRQKAMSAYATRVMELTTYACADAVGVVTEQEVEQLSQDLTQTPVFLLPLVHDPVSATPGRDGRAGLVFVGGFLHEPNVDAVLWFVREIYPLVTRRHPDTDVYVIGQDPTDEINALASRNVHILGRVPATAPYLNRAAVSIAPLRYGSGMKGKVTEALSYGLPVVTTSVGAEGIGIVSGVHAVVADTAEDFANEVCRVLEDETLWYRLSSGGKRLIEERLGSAQMRQRLGSLLSALLTGERPAARVQQSDAVSAVQRKPALHDPEQSPAYVEALAAAESGDTERAIQLLVNHLEEAPEHAGGWSDLGVLHYRKGNVSEAREHFERALATPGGWRTLACENFVECLLAWGQPAQAKDLARQWMEQAADIPEPWLLWARLSFQDGRVGEARDAAERALAIDPANKAAAAYLNHIGAANRTVGTPNKEASRAFTT